MKVIPFPDETLADQEWNDVPAEKVISGTPKSTYKISYASSNEQMVTGVYACTPGKWRVFYTEDEFCTLLEGEVHLTAANGEMQTFKAPESFLIPSGYKGIWEAVTAIRKIFVIYEGAAEE